MTQKRVLVFSSNAATHSLIQKTTAPLGFVVDEVRTSHNVVNVVDDLVARQPQLIVLDLDAAQSWQAFVIAAKTSPATRKIPILAFGLDGARAHALGCDHVVSGDDLRNNAAALIQQTVRADESAELARQAALPLPTLAHKAIAQFNAHEFWEQHETFEEMWRAEPGPVRQMYQGILQVGVAYLQIQRQNFGGARKLFQRAWQYLNVLPDVCQGIDIAQFKRDAQAAQTELERLGAANIHLFSSAFFQPIQIVSRQSSVVNPK